MEVNAAALHDDGVKKVSQLITGYQFAIGAYCVSALPISGFPGLAVGLAGNMLMGATSCGLY